jgi:hypothetical protein
VDITGGRTRDEERTPLSPVIAVIRKSRTGGSPFEPIPAISGDLGDHGDLSGLPGVFSLDSSGTAGLPWVWNRHIIRLLWPFLFDQSGGKRCWPFGEVAEAAEN